MSLERPGRGALGRVDTLPRQVYAHTLNRLDQSSGIGNPPELWPTASVKGNYMNKEHDKTTGNGLGTETRLQSGQIEGVLNPRWVETLMGLPIGWTDPQPGPIESMSSGF